jgi:hypothetical protein
MNYFGQILGCGLTFFIFTFENFDLTPNFSWDRTLVRPEKFGGLSLGALAKIMGAKMDPTFMVGPLWLAKISLISLSFARYP